MLKEKSSHLFPYDLQYFQGERTEKATPKKKREAREKGQVVQSKDIGSAVSLILVFLSLQLFIGFMIEEVFGLYHWVIDFSSDSSLEFGSGDVGGLFQESVLSLLKISLPLLLVALVSAVIINYMQVGFLFTAEPLKFKLDKLSPLKGFKRLFSMKSVVEMVKSILKAAGVLFICYNYITSQQEVLVSVLNLPLMAAILTMWDIIFNIVMRCGALLFILGILDYVYKRWENSKELKMSKQEIKEEYKQVEGDPFIKGKIKEKQRQMAMSRMMQEVPQADVVITNPTHFAVALKYNRDSNEAPKVVAKGRDLIAFKIKELAKENGVHIIENKPLARSLYDSCELGDEIPPRLYEAVADVLAYVYKLKKMVA